MAKTESLGAYIKDIPLYHEVTRDHELIQSLAAIMQSENKFDCFCVACNKESVFSGYWFRNDWVELHFQVSTPIEARVQGFFKGVFDDHPSLIHLSGLSHDLGHVGQ